MALKSYAASKAADQAVAYPADDSAKGSAVLGKPHNLPVI